MDLVETVNSCVKITNIKLLNVLPLGCIEQFGHVLQVSAGLVGVI